MISILRYFSLRLTYLILPILITALAAPAFASNGLLVVTSGPRSLGIGGAGVAYDPTSNTLVNNPAGLAFVGNQFDLSFTVAFPNTRMGSSAAPAGNPDAVFVNGFDDGILLPTGSASFRLFGDKLVAGVGAFFSAGFNVDFPVSRFNSAITGNRYDRSGRYANLKIVPGASYQVLDNLSIGVGLDINYAFFQTDNATLAPGFPETVGTNRTDSALGIGGRIGVQYKPVKMLSIGAMYVTRQHFQAFDRYPDILDTGLDLPQEVIFGISLQPLSGFRILGDFRWIDWSSGFLGRDLALGGLEWRDQYVFAGGAEYDFAPKFDFPVAVRMGYNYGRSPITPKNAFRNLLIPLTIQHHLTFGLSFDMNKHIGMDAAYVHEFGTVITDDGSGGPTGAGSFVGASANAFSIGLRGRWGGEDK
ncbi:MAG TPA: outer membrane protein transport protein [bacterium]|nr:outer membrane protein transport protein [bacterium]